MYVCIHTHTHTLCVGFARSVLPEYTCDVICVSMYIYIERVSMYYIRKTLSIVSMYHIRKTLSIVSLYEIRKTLSIASIYYIRQTLSLVSMYHIRKTLSVVSLHYIRKTLCIRMGKWCGHELRWKKPTICVKRDLISVKRDLISVSHADTNYSGRNPQCVCFLVRNVSPLASVLCSIRSLSVLY